MIKGWREGDAGAGHQLLGLMFDPELEGRIEQFRNQFQPQDLCRLLIGVLQQLSVLPITEKVEKLERIRLPGLFRSFLMLIRSEISSVEFANCLVSIFGSHVRHDLWLVERVLCLLVYHKAAYILKSYADVVVSRFSFILRDSFAVDEAKALLDSLLSKDPWVLWKCIRYTEVADFEIVYKSGHPISIAWGKLREILLRLAEQDRSVGIPYLAVFVVDTKRQSRSSAERMKSGGDLPVSIEGEFNEAEAKARFGDQYDRLMKLFLDIPTLEGLDDATRAAVEAASR